MIARGKFDLSFKDWAKAFSPPQNSHIDNGLPCYTVRTAFHIYLQICAFEKGSEILVSSVTIPDMVKIIEHHGLKPVFVELNFANLEIDYQDLKAKITPKTKAILFAHLFGGIMPLDRLAQIANEHNLKLIEDCAQCYDGQYKGHKASDITLFSFGNIKSQTAFGGAIVYYKKKEQFRTINQTFVLIGNKTYIKKILKFLAVSLLIKPWIYGVFYKIIKHMKIDFDNLIAKATKSFRAGDFITNIEKQLSEKQLRFLHYRLNQTTNFNKRIEYAQKIYEKIPQNMQLGREVKNHNHWVLPIICKNPTETATFLQENGFDASVKASSMMGFTKNSKEIMQQVIFLPMAIEMSDKQMVKMLALLLLEKL